MNNATNKNELFNKVKASNKFVFFSDIKEDEINFLANPNKFPFTITLEQKDLNELISNTYSNKENKIHIENDDPLSEKDVFFDQILELRREREKKSIPTEKPILENDVHFIFTCLEITEHFGEKEFQHDSFLYSKDKYNYRLILPERRFRYLNWLIDVTKPIEIGYSEMYLSCLERNIFSQNLNEIINEILLLRKYHNNKPFLNRSEKSLNTICFFMKRLDLLYDLYLKNEIEYSNFIFQYQTDNNIELSPLDVFNLQKKLSFKLTKYKNKQEIYLNKISDYLFNKYRSKGLPNLIDMKNILLPKKNLYFLNHNLNFEIGDLEYYELYYDDKFNEELGLLYKATY